jgi:acylphosphatase
MDTGLARLHVIIEGRVQGVGYRYFVIDVADSLGVTGWVRNCWDETVEVMAEGERQPLENLLAALQRGPRAAYVTRVKTEWQDPTGEFIDFRIRAAY